MGRSTTSATPMQISMGVDVSFLHFKYLAMRKSYTAMWCYKLGFSKLCYRRKYKLLHLQKVKEKTFVALSLYFRCVAHFWWFFFSFLLWKIYYDTWKIDSLISPVVASVKLSRMSNAKKALWTPAELCIKFLLMNVWKEFF